MEIWLYLSPFIQMLYFQTAYHTFIKVGWCLAGVATAIGTALFRARALAVGIAALHAGGCEA